ncbi:hypothetical protein CMK12_03225 [Candidatus Poribacteria bacterium]|nr:hypothetical protein [Candidatus Poribacteria bacterium]
MTGPGFATVKSTSAGRLLLILPIPIDRFGGSSAVAACLPAWLKLSDQTTLTIIDLQADFRLQAQLKCLPN